MKRWERSRQQGLYHSRIKFGYHFRTTAKWAVFAHGLQRCQESLAALKSNPCLLLTGMCSDLAEKGLDGGAWD